MLMRQVMRRPFRSLASPAFARIEGVGYVAEAVALFARMDTQPTAARKGSINTAITALKAAGIWTKLDALYVMAAHDAQAAQRNWIADAFNLTPVSSPTFTTDRGYKGNGTSSYLNTGFNPVTAAGNYAQDSAHFGIWPRTNAQSSAIDMGMRVDGVTKQANIFTRSAADATSIRVNVNSGTLNPNNTSSMGHFVSARTSSSLSKTYRNSASLGSVTDASAALASLNFYIGALNQNGTAASFSTREYAVAHIGAGLSDAEVADLYDILLDYLIDIDAMTIFVDPALGSDATADGFSSATPYATLTAAITSKPASIKIKSGSTLVESAGPSIDLMRLAPYGGTSPWTLDIRQHLSAPSWGLVSGTTNVYETTVTHREATVVSGVSDLSWNFAAWLDDTYLTWLSGGADLAANAALVEAQPGSFTVYKSGSTTPDPRDDTAGTSYVYRVHLPDGSDPTGEDIAIADRNGLATFSRSRIEGGRFIGNGGKDMLGDNDVGTGSTLVDCRVVDGALHGWVGLPVQMENWGGTRRTQPGFSTGDNRGNLVTLYQGTNAQKALDSSISLRDVGDGWDKLIYSHTAGGQTDRIGNDLVIDGQGITINDLQNVLFATNGTDPLFSSITVRDLNVTEGKSGVFAPGTGTEFNVSGGSWVSAATLAANTGLFGVAGADALIEDFEWEFLHEYDVSKLHWLTSSTAPDGMTLTLRRCVDRAWNTNRRALMRRATGAEEFHLVVEDSTLGNLMDQVDGVNWPLSVTASNSTLGFGNRTQAEVEAALTLAGVTYSFTNCTFVNTSGVAY